MASTYHPIYSGLWNDDALEGLSFECHAFFAFLCSNDHVRPSGIYRVTDAPLVAETGVQLAKVRRYLSVLIERQRILRDGGWLFVCGYFKRQPKQERLLNGVRSDIEICSSLAILEAFGLRYSHFSRWSTDRLKTLSNPMNHFVSTEQCNAEHNNAMQCSGPSGDGHPPPRVAAPRGATTWPRGPRPPPPRLAVATGPNPPPRQGPIPRDRAAHRAPAPGAVQKRGRHS